jgi:hypothetical protein
LKILQGRLLVRVPFGEEQKLAEKA